MILLNNDGDGTERPMLEGGFNAALRDALADDGQLQIIEAVIPRGDFCPVLAQLTAGLRKRARAEY